MQKLALQVGVTFFDSLKIYVGFTAASSAALRELYPLARPFFAQTVDDFYAVIQHHPGARASITGGAEQIARLKQTLLSWLEKMLLGPHDEAYYELRARIGQVHVRIALPQQYMFTAMNRIRVKLLHVVGTKVAEPTQAQRIATALNQILDLELAIMLETYREHLVEQNRNAERLATIGQFAASIGHELRNPLSVIDSSLFLLRQHLEEQMDLSYVAKHLDRAAREVVRANSTISDLLDLARNRPPQRQPSALRPLVQTAVQASLLPATVSVDLDGLPEQLTVDVDADQFRQVLVNLFTNAAQASPGGVHILAEADALPDGGTRLWIRNDGPGVLIEHRHRIFDALFTTKPKGSGLGLTLCRRIMEAHGGTIDLEPSERGASFVLWIPVSGSVPDATTR